MNQLWFCLITKDSNRKWACFCCDVGNDESADCSYKSIDIEVSISISILLRQSIDISIDDTFKAGIDIEYRRYFWKISITTLLVANTVYLTFTNVCTMTSIVVTVVTISKVWYHVPLFLLRIKAVHVFVDTQLSQYSRVLSVTVLLSGHVTVAHQLSFLHHFHLTK